MFDNWNLANYNSGGGLGIITYDAQLPLDGNLSTIVIRAFTDEALDDIMMNLWGGR